MSKKSKKGLMQQLFPAEGEAVPKLRFPEFRDMGGWENKSIGEVTTVIAGATPSTNNPNYWGGDIPWMNSGELNLKRVYKVSNGITALGLKETSTKLIPLSCILIGLAGQGKTRGTVAINYIELCTNQSIATILPNIYEFVSEFLFHKLDSMYFYLRSLSKGEGGRGGLNLQIIKSVKISLPRLEEQQKIADCLSSIDDLITAQAKKIESLKDHKKGLMQQLFPAEGETVPKLRFPEFLNTSDWKPLKLSELSHRINEKVGEKKLTTVSITAGYGFVSQTEKFSRDISGKQYKNYIHLKIGEFSYNKGNSKKFAQGCIYKLKEFEEVAVPGAFISFKFKDAYVADFYQGYFDNNAHGKQLLRYITSGARSDGLLNIKPDVFFSIVLPSPEERYEQQKIADCLSSLDNLITAQTQKVESLKAHKKGLMQQLFPVDN